MRRAYQVLPLPRILLVGIGKLAEGSYWLLGGRLGMPPMNEFEARKGSTTHHFSIEKARRRLGYSPLPLSVLLPPVRDHIAKTWRPKHAVPAVGARAW